MRAGLRPDDYKEKRGDVPQANRGSPALHQSQPVRPTAKHAQTGVDPVEPFHST